MSQQESLAHKYRPKKLDDLIGQDVLVQTLKNSFKNNSLHHSYIFGGKFGSGKTSAARILAAMLNNDTGPTLEPDPTQPICASIFEGSCNDVHELDAASNRGVDEARKIAKEVQYAPVECRYKIVIIDEAHSLTDIAAESLLKLIEEPPKNVIFIFCTTDPHLLKATIHSRSQPFQFTKVGWKQLSEHLKKVANNEGIDYEEDALAICARTSSGSPRNALQNLQHLWNYADNSQITVDDARKVLGAIEDRHFFDLIEFIVNTNVSGGIATINQMLQDGKRTEEVVDGLHSHLRNLLIARTCSDDLAEFGFGEEEIARYKHQSKEVGVQLLLTMMSLIVELNRGLSYNLDPQIQFETFMFNAIAAKTRSKKNGS